MSITLTYTFASHEELVAHLAFFSTAPAKTEAPGKPDASAAKTARSQRTVEAAPSTPAPSAAAPEKKAPETTPPAAAAASASAPADAIEVDYPTLQKAVGKLVALAKAPAALEVAKAFGFESFLPLKDAANAAKRAEVLAAVEAKIAELQGA